MKKLMMITFAAVVACVISNEEKHDDCFDKEKLQTYWKQARDECRESIPDDTIPDYRKQMTICILKKHDLMSEEGLVYYDKLRKAYDDNKSRDLEEELAKMDACWTQSDSITSNFFDCWTPLVETYCPDVVKWLEDA